MSTSIPPLRRLTLKARIGWLVGLVSVFLQEVMDVTQMLITPDTTEMFAAIARWPEATAQMGSVIADNSRLFWFMRGNVVLLSLVAGLAAARFAGALQRSLADLQRTARQVAAGDLQSPVHVEGPREVQRLSRSIDHMRMALQDVMRIARENVVLKKDIALGEAASSLLAPDTASQGDGTRLLGFHTAAGDASGFWWHARGNAGREYILLGYVAGSGPAAVMSLAALAGAARDELLHVERPDPEELVARCQDLSRQLTPRESGLCVLTVEPGREGATWVCAGPARPCFFFHRAMTLGPAGDDLARGTVSFDQQLAVLLGPHDATAPPMALQLALERAANSNGHVPDIAALLPGEGMPAAVVMLQRSDDAGSRAA